MSKMLSVSVVVLALLGLAGPLMAADVGKGNILVEQWFTNDTGQQVNNDVTTLHSFINAGNAPNVNYWAQQADVYLPDAVEYWGSRMRGYLYPPQTGDYTFWTVSDDDSEVWLSTDEDPANAVMICNVEGWAAYQDWTYATNAVGPNVKSAPIKLTAGKKYYIDVFAADGTGGGYVTVGWGGPTIGTGPVIIAGKYLAPWIRDPEPLFLAHEPISPYDGEPGIITPVLKWTKGGSAIKHTVYGGLSPDFTAADILIQNKIMANMQVSWPEPEGGFVPGATYYWRVDEIDAAGKVYQGPVWSFSIEPLNAFKPVPADESTGAALGLRGEMENYVTLRWTPPAGTSAHHVYFSNKEADVVNRAAVADKGNPDSNSIDVAGGLRGLTTYYWCVDETAMDWTTFEDVLRPGPVWSFTTTGDGGVMYELYDGTGGGTAVTDLTGNAAYPDNPTGTSVRSQFRAPVDRADNFGGRLRGWLVPPQTGDYTFWIASDDGGELWLSTDSTPAKAVRIATVAAWTNDQEWTKETNQKSAVIKLEANKRYYIMALYKEGGGGDNCAVAWGGPGISGPSLLTSQYVYTFLLPPIQAYGPSPANKAANAPYSGSLSWLAGEGAQKHNVYLGEDADAVAAADTTSPLFKGAATESKFEAGTLEWGKTYYWRVDEVGATSTATGNVWSFTTRTYMVVDDFEAYTGDEGQEIWSTWFDNYVDGAPVQKGAWVGYEAAPYVEVGTGYVHGGSKSMPLHYDNTGPTPLFSQAYRPVDDGNWTVNGLTDLSLWVRGFADMAVTPFTESAPGKMSVTNTNGADIWGSSDQFTYVYKTLTGDGTIQARVMRFNTGVDAWTKGGVMIRDSLDGVSASAQMCMTGGNGNGATFQNRATAGLDMGANDATSNVTVGALIAPPYWVKIERVGNTFTGSLSTDGVAWTILSSADVVMGAPVYIGLCVSAHSTADTRTYDFENISTTGGVSGSWQQAVITSRYANNAAGLYVTVEDTTGKKATQSNATAVNAANYTQVTFPLSGFTGVSLSKIKNVYISVGDPKTTAAGGQGQIYIDDIRVIKQ